MNIKILVLSCPLPQGRPVSKMTSRSRSLRGTSSFSFSVISLIAGAYKHIAIYSALLIRWLVSSTKRYYVFQTISSPQVEQMNVSHPVCEIVLPMEKCFLPFGPATKSKKTVPSSYSYLIKRHRKGAWKHRKTDSACL